MPEANTAEAVLHAIARLPPLERNRFSALLAHGYISTTLPLVVSACRAALEEHGLAIPAVTDGAILAKYHEIVAGITSLGRALEKARRDPPKRFAERDAEIMRLHGQGKLPGQVRNLVKGRWPKDQNGRPLTVAAVRQVIRRHEKPAGG